MKLHVFNNDFIRIGILSNYKSLTWTEFYQDVGRISITATDAPENIKLLRQGNIIYQSGKDTAMIIRYVKYDSAKREIEANGFTIMDLLLQRIISPAVSVYNAETGLYKIVNDNLRGLPHVVTADVEGFTETFDTQVTGKMFEGLQKVAVETDLGLKMLFDYRRKLYIFKAYRGVTRTAGQRDPVPMIFSEEFKNLANMTITDDMSVFANVAYVAGAGEGAARKIVIVGDATGIDRHEIYIDARDVQPNEGESVDSERYVNLLRSRGIAKLNEHIAVKTFKAEVDPVNFRVKYNLGDKVTCKSEKYGIQVNTRIMAYSEVTERNMTTLSLTLGEPEITIIKELKINGTA